MNPLGRFVDPEARAAADAVTRDVAVATPNGEATSDRPDVLRRFLGPRPRRVTGEACELCSVPIDERHRHVVDVATQSLRCACRGCALLFEGAGTSGFRAVPDRYERLDPFVLDPLQWNALQIPVGTAFFMVSTPMATTVAFYPSPGGATESELPLDTWDQIVTANPPIADVLPDVEAILVRTNRRSRPGAAGATADPDAAAECFIVPIDRCYELVGELRMHWRGFDGGQEVRERIDAFFTEIDTRSRRVGVSR